MAIGWNGRSFSLALWRSSGRGSRVVEAFGAFAHDPSANEAFERAQGTLIFRRYEADGVAHCVRAARPANAVDIVLGVHREVIIDHMGDAVHIDPAGGNVGRDQHAYGAGLEILQGAQALVL
jgi:hypothetical protein